MTQTPIDANGERDAAALAAATAVLDAHVPDAAGFCVGCREQWHRLVPRSGCTQVVWAQGVHGVVAGSTAPTGDDRR